MSSMDGKSSMEDIPQSFYGQKLFDKSFINRRPSRRRHFKDIMTCTGIPWTKKFLTSPIIRIDTFTFIL